MRRFAAVGALVAFLTIAGTGEVSAQAVYVGGGLNFPTGDFDVLAQSGFSVLGGVGLGIGDAGLFVDVTGLYSTHDHHGDSGDKTNIFGALGEIGYSFAPEDGAGLYVLAGGGWVANQLQPGDGGEDVNQNLLGLTGAVGYGFPLGGSASGWFEARVLDTDDDSTSSAGLFVGVTFAFGGDN